jgi:hypothetical protein
VRPHFATSARPAAVHNKAVIDLYRRLLHGFGGTGLVTNLLIALGVTLVMTAAAVGAVVLLPPDHFNRPPGQDSMARAHPVRRWVLIILKNALGLLIVPLGVVMALPLVPGPGLVFILVGLSLLDFPGKRSLERRLLAVPAVLRFLNRVREHFHKPPLVI